jgi:hypothetical protein
MSARDRAQARQLPVEFSQPPSERRGGRHQAHSGRGFTLSNSSIPNGAAGVQRMREVPPDQQQISQPPPMSDAQAAQHRRQTQTDRQEESSRRRRAFESSRKNLPAAGSRLPGKTLTRQWQRECEHYGDRVGTLTCFQPSCRSALSGGHADRLGAEQDDFISLGRASVPQCRIRPQGPHRHGIQRTRS